VPFGNGFVVRSTGHFGPKVPMNHTPQRPVTSESTRSIFSTHPPKWPALEKTLVKHFTVARTENKIVTVHWSRRMAQQIWQRLYPQLADVFVFSNGWFLEVSTPPWHCASKDHQSGHETTRRGCESAELLHPIHSEE
jgi:hypothetical protein